MSLVTNNILINFSVICQKDPENVPFKMCIIPPGHGDVVSSCVAHPTRTSRAASASADGVVKVWDLQGKKCVKTLSGGHGGRYVRGIAFNPSGSRLISGKLPFLSQD